MTIKELKIILERYPEEHDIYVRGTGDYESYHKANVSECCIEHGRCGFYVNRTGSDNCIVMS